MVDTHRLGGPPMAPMQATLIDRLYGLYERLLGNPRFQRWAASFPLTRPLARARARGLFDLCAGFVYSQVLLACVRLDLFDVLAYIAFALAPITRQERADAGRPAIAAHYSPQLQGFLDFVLAQYVKDGVGELDQAKLPQLLELRYRAVSDAAAELGGAANIRNAFIDFQRHLYR